MSIIESVVRIQCLQLLVFFLRCLVAMPILDKVTIDKFRSFVAMCAQIVSIPAYETHCELKGTEKIIVVALSVIHSYVI